MASLKTTRIRFATSPYFVVMLIIHPIIIRYHEAVEGEDVRMGGITVLISWWVLALIGFTINIFKWNRLGLGGQLGMIVLGVLSIAPLVFLLFFVII